MLFKCQKGLIIKERPALTPIISTFAMKRVVIDLVGPLKETASGNKYMIVMTDHFSKFPLAYGIPNKTAAIVAEKLLLNLL